jgi:hypothetical protein
MIKSPQSRESPETAKYQLPAGLLASRLLAPDQELTSIAQQPNKTIDRAYLIVRTSIDEDRTQDIALTLVFCEAE